MYYSNDGATVSQHQEIGSQATDTLAASVVKAGSAWFLVILSKLGINTWSDLSAVLACVLTTLLIIDWFWKKLKAWKSGHDAV